MTGVLHIVLARKPIEGTLVENFLRWGCGALNIDGCRIEANGEKTGGNGYWGLAESRGWNANDVPYKSESRESTTQGRWPANLIHDGSDEVVGLFPVTGSSARPNSRGKVYRVDNVVYGEYKPRKHDSMHADSGSASRFFFNFSEQEADE